MNNSFFTKAFSALLIVILALAFMPVTPARAATLTVNTNADGPVAVNGLCSLREAIINANNDAATNIDCVAGTGADIIQFSAAVSTITVTGFPLPAITDPDGLSIDGGGVVTVDGGGAFRIFNVNGGAFTVQNITLSNGQAATGNGGAILYVGGVGLTVSSSTFNTNRTTAATGLGGAIYHTTGTLSITNSTFDGNYTGSNGGAVYIANGTGTMTITNSAFTNQNNATLNDGAALYLALGTLEINGGNFTGNRTAGGNGGAIFKNGGSLTVGNTSSVSFINNSSSGNGGAISSHNGGTLIVTGTFTGNSGSFGGALFYLTSAGTFTVSNSTFTNNTAVTGNAGAIRSGGNLTLTNSTFTNNSAALNGGAIWHTTNSLAISGSTFDGNYTSALGDGGAIYLVSASGTATVDNTNFTNQNNAGIDDGAGLYIDGFIPGGAIVEINGGGFTGNTATGNGGGIAVGANGTLTIGNTSGVTFTNNTAGGGGGAIYNNGISPFSISDSTFQNNTALNGGAMLITAPSANLNVSNSTFTGNTAVDDGGAIVNNANPATITNSLFQNNSVTGISPNNDGGAIQNTLNADGTTIRLSSFIGNSTTNMNDNNARGGAIANSGANFVLANVTFSGNSANETAAVAGNAQGGAVWSDDNATIHNVTFSGNSVSDTGTGAADGGNLFQNAGTLTVANSILNGGTENGAAGNCGGIITDGGNNISFSAADCGAGFSNSNPLLGALTGSPAYYPLNAGSSAIGTGNPTTCQQVTTTNDISQNGLDRITVVTDPTCDIGSYEAPATATLTIVKEVVNNDGGTGVVGDFNITTDAGALTFGAGVTVVDTTTYTATTLPLLPGTYTLREDDIAGYTEGTWSCTDGTLNDNTISAGEIVLTNGDTATCTITNDDIAPTLTIVKEVVNNDGGTGVVGDFNITTDAGALTFGAGVTVVDTTTYTATTLTLSAGTYTLREDDIAGYTEGTWSCTDGTLNDNTISAGEIVLTNGDTATCTITNDDTAVSLTIIKEVVNDDGGTGVVGDFNITTDAGALTFGAGVTVVDTTTYTATTLTLSAGTYTLREDDIAGYTEGTWSCTDGTLNDSSISAGEIVLALGEVATCTITNNDIAPTLTLVKDVTNNDGGTAVIGDWTLDATGPSAINGVIGTGSVTNAIVDAGSYSLSETGPTGYTQTAITCSGNDANGADGLDLDPGENVTCTFFNDDIGATLTLLKDVTNDNIGTAVDTDWTLTATGLTTISGVEGAAPVTGAGVSAGNYILTESGPANYTQTAITCVGGTDANGADGLSLALGETVTCTFFNDDDVPVLLVPNVNSTPDTGDGSIADGEVILNTLNISQLIVQFNWDADNPSGTAGTDDVDNPNNYILLYSATGTFNTPSCAVVAGGGVVAPDIRIPVTTVAYSNGGGSGPFIATLNLSASLTNAGYYRLFVCGTTSIVLAADPTVVLSGNGTPGTDFTRNFRINADPGNGGGGTPIDDDDELTVAALPATGFAPNRVTMLAEQPKELAYTSLGDLWIEIPALGVKSSIVGVPQTKEAEWNVTWLANNVGWLNGTAFPTWEGNSVLTAHVTNADGLAGPFANLTKLKFGDQIIVHAFGQKYIFELRNSRMVKPFSTSFAFEDLEDESYLTLITCQVYLPKSDTYLYRRVIRAVLVSVENE